MDMEIEGQHVFALGTKKLPAILRLPAFPYGLVIFAHGSGSSHRSRRNNMVAEALTEAGFATVLFDLLTPAEVSDRANVFDIGLLASRLVETIETMNIDPDLRRLPIGLFGASTGGGAALLAAAMKPELIGAVVSRGGRPDLAGVPALQRVKAPTLLIVGGADHQVIELNEAAAGHLHCTHEVVVIPGAGHLFEEPGTLAQVIDHASDWFTRHLSKQGRWPL